MDRDEHAAAVLAALAWIVTFCDEHPEWFGNGGCAEAGSEDGAEYEWLEHARKLVWEKM